ncbi:MAG TPA: SufD family Fe-S cluster assembly protein [Allosphingosinicella sp.]|jgi:Fe-S cluster assembly protein SufD|nr:SufD family Fe-S cluster assembly protein [Allosphingosinicella sp.]
MLDLPSHRDEAWRWSDLSALPEIVAREPRGIVPDALPWIDCAREGPRLLFVDGRLAEEQSRLGGIEIGDVAVEAHDHALASLAGQSGWTLKLGRDHALAGLIQIVHVSTGGADHLAAEIELDVDAQASVVETFIGQGWANRLTGIILYKGARLMLARRLLGDSGFVSLFDRATVGEGASLAVTTLAAGGTDTRLDGNIRLAGEGAYAEAGGALLARGRQRHDVNLLVRHDLPGGMSRQVWRSAADDRAICSVAARVEVARGAQKTDGEQSLKGLLLSRSATINAKPELEIFADDVKCAHGATVGELDRDALFYMASRGVPAAEARALLTRAFVADALSRIGEEAVRDAFDTTAQDWLSDSLVPSEVEGRS